MGRLMSDYEVNLVNDSMQEFYVRFYGPAESMSSLTLEVYHRAISIDSVSLPSYPNAPFGYHSTIRRRCLEDPRRTT